MKALVSLIVICVVTGCGNGSSAPRPSGPFFPCPALEGTGDLNYPVAGAMDVVDAEHLVIVSGGIGNPALSLQLQSGAAVLTSQTIVPLPNPLPQPYAPSTFGPTVAFRVPPLDAKTTYSVTTSGAPPCRLTTVYGFFTTK